MRHNLNKVRDAEAGTYYTLSSTGVTSLKRRPRTSARLPKDDCIVYFADDPTNVVRVIPRVKPRTTSPKPRSRRSSLTTAEAIDLINKRDARLHGTTAANLAPIGDID